MVETQTIKEFSLLALVLVSLGLGATDFDFDNYNYYYCEERPELIYTCEGFSKYVSEYGKCLNATFPGAPEVNLGNKICKAGWQLITDDTVISEPIVNVSKNEPILSIKIYDPNTKLIEDVFISIDEIDQVRIAKVNNKCVYKDAAFTNQDILNVLKLGVDC